MAKQLVLDFYQSDAFRNAEVIEKYIHDDAVIHWHSTTGYRHLNKNDLKLLAEEMKKSYHSSRLTVSHILQEDDTVSVRYVHYVSPIENPSDEIILAHFMTIWELQDGKLFRGYQMSQLG